MVGISTLQLIHRHKSLGESSHSEAQIPMDSFYLNTCQREIWIRTQSEELCCSQIQNWQDRGYDVYHDFQAYQFILEMTCGLKSALPGETEIFGQFKKGWSEFLATLHPEAKQLLPLIQKLFEDTKNIRFEFLQGNGGASYGSLVRQILREKDPSDVGLIGAGKLAHAVGPYLLDRKINLWNRNQDRVAALSEILEEKASQTPTLAHFTPQDEKAAWTSSSHLVVCIPPCPEKDPQRIQWIQDHDIECLIHLGCSSTQEASMWREALGRKVAFYSLNDLFRLQKNQSQKRSSSIQKAIEACRQKARLRLAAEDALFTGTSSEMHTSLLQAR
jgi:hypothetical protein